MRAYLSGPMRGYPRFNFDRFEVAYTLMKARGHEVKSPHTMDLEIGFDPNKSLEENKFDTVAAVRRDVEAIIWCEAVVLLPDWEKSTGANAERAIALWLDRDIYPFHVFMAL